MAIFTNASTRVHGTAKSLCPTRSLIQSSVQQKSSRYESVSVRADSGNGRESSARDWDTAWRKFKQQGTAQEQRRGGTATKPPSFNTNTQQWNSGPTADDIRRQESTLLDAWTTETFSQISIIGIVLLFVAVVIAAGPPPTDARCTLPWC